MNASGEGGYTLKRTSRADAPTMSNLPTSKARNAFARTLGRVARTGEPIVLIRRGKRVAAIVSVEDLDRLAAMEDAADIADADAAVAEMKRTGEKPIPWEQVKRDLGL